MRGKLWKVMNDRRAEKFLVCVGSSPSSEELIRLTHQLATALGASWLALHVDNGKTSPGERERVERHLQLAKSLCAEVEVEKSNSLFDAIARVAARGQVTTIVTRRTLGSAWRRWLGRDLESQILRRAPDLDLLVLGAKGTLAPSLERRYAQDSPKLISYGAGLGLVVLATALGFPLQTVLSPTNLVMLYLAAVVCSAYFFGRGASNLAAFFSVLVFDFFFVSPRHTLVVDERESVFTFLGLLLSGLAVAELTAKAKEQASAARAREEEALALLALSRDLAQAMHPDETMNLARKHLASSFGESRVHLSEELESLKLDSMAIKQAVEGQYPTGKGTTHLPESEFQWHPLCSPGGQVWGAIGLATPVRLGERRQEELLEAFRSHIASALERYHLLREAQEASLLRASERLHSALLNSISHDLRIPLVSIQGALSSLTEQQLDLDEPSRMFLIENALDETDRLNRLVGNLLQMTRLESGYLTVKKLPCDVEDLVATTVGSTSGRIARREVKTSLPPELPLVALDFVLIQQVLTNLLENAAKFSPEEAEIRLVVGLEQDCLFFEVHDKGPGIPEEDLDRVFKRFERLNQDTPGTGLGLSICKGLVEAHGGTISVRNDPLGGAIFRVEIPVGEVMD